MAEDLNLEKTLPMVFGQVLPHEPTLARFTYRDEIRDQMVAADAISGRLEAIFRIRMVSIDGIRSAARFRALQCRWAAPARP